MKTMPYGRKSSTRSRAPARRSRAFTRPARKKVPYKYAKSLKLAVKREVAKGRENKRAALAIKPTTVPAVIATTQTLNVFPVMPEISQGTKMFGQRIGNKITPKWMTIKGWCTLDMTDEDPDYDRIGVRIFVGHVKQYPLYEDAINAANAAPANNWSYALLDYAGSPSQFDGTLNALQSPTNHRMWTSKAERRFTLMRPRIWNAPLTGDDFARSTAGSYKFFSMRVRCPPTVNYSTDGDVRSKNFQPVLLAGYSLLNGNIPADPTIAPKQMTISYTVNLSYEDA